MIRSSVWTTLGVIGLACLCAAPKCGDSDTPDGDGGASEDGGGTGATDQQGVSVPASLSGTNASSTLAIKLTFASQADYNDTKYLAALFVKDADPAGACAKVWSQSLDLTDPSRLNIMPYPLQTGAITYEPGEGDQAVFLYTFTNLPSAVCLKDSDCPASASGDASGACVPGGAGLGICTPTTLTLPTSGGCGVTSIKNQGAATADVTMTERPVN